MTELIITSGKLQGKKLILPSTEVVIGRGDECQIRLASNDISRTHCAIRQGPEGLLVRDLGSRNGTYINDIPISAETLMKPGDLLRVGPLELRLPGERPAVSPGTKPLSSTEIRIPTKRPAKGKASDDDIAEWLSPQIPGGSEARTSDTTIIPGRASSSSKSESEEVSPLEPGPATAPEASKNKFRSVADEAADIIRRHRESARNSENS